MKYLRSLLCGALICISSSPAMAADCSIKKFASFDARIDTGALLVRAKVDGKEVWALFDTGAPNSMISEALAQELKLPTNHTHWAGVDAAGHEFNVSATVHKLELGDFYADNVDFLVAGHERSNRSLWFDVLFGDNFLERQGVDLELDLAHGKVNFFSSDHCPGQGVYWAHEYAPIPIRIQDHGHIYLPVTLEGRETHAMLDTGASLTLVDKHFAEQTLGVPFNGGKDKMDGNLVVAGGTTMGYYKHAFGTFDIGGITFRNTELAVSVDRINAMNRSADSNPHVTLTDNQFINAPITLGLKHLSKLRIYFSFAEHMLYVTPANAQ